MIKLLPKCFYKKGIGIVFLLLANSLYAQDVFTVDGIDITLIDDVLLRIDNGNVVLINEGLFSNKATISVNGSWYNNNSTNLAFALDSEGQVIFNRQDTIPAIVGGTNSTVFYNLELDLFKLDLDINTTVGGYVSGLNAGVLTLNNSMLGLNNNTLSISNSDENAVVFTTGNIESENVLNQSKVSWQTSPTGLTYVFPFGSSLGQLIPISVTRTSGDLGNLTFSTFNVDDQMTPYPTIPDPVSSIIRSDGIDVTNISVTRFWQLDKTGNGTADLILSYTENELPVMDESNFMAVRYNSSSNIWEILGTSTHFPVTNEVAITGVTEFSPWAINGNVNDNDGDSVADLDDIDNDNDGITDLDEGICAPAQSGTWILSGTSATYDYGNGVIARAITTSNNFTTGSFNGSGTGFWSENLNSDASLEGEFDWNTSLTISFEDSLGNPITVEDPILHIDRLGERTAGRQSSARLTLQGGLIWHKLSGTDDFLSSNTTAEDAGANLNTDGRAPYTPESSQDDRNGTAAGTMQIDGVINSFTLNITRVGGNSTKSDEIEFILFACHSDDADNDLIPNYLDLDSDNDGIPDNVEAQLTVGYVVPSGDDTDLNGLDDVYEVSPGSGEGLTVVNTDGMDNPDYTDLNSDNEGGNDTAEAGITLANNDADGDGLDDVTDASGDYSDPGGTIDNMLVAPIILPDGDGDATTGGDVDYRDALVDSRDTDNDGIFDDVDLDDDNDGILDTVECPTLPGTFVGSDTGVINFAAGVINYTVVQNSINGYSAVNYNTTADGLELDHSASNGGNDAFTYTLSLSGIPAGYKPVIRLYQAINRVGGNSEASDYTVNWTGAGNALLVDEASPDPSMYRFGAPAAFDLNNRQIEGTNSRVNLNNGNTFRSYAVYNSRVEWYLELPVGVTDITVNKIVLTGANTGNPGCNSGYSEDPSCGIDAEYPMYGNSNASAPVGESFREWITFKVEFIPDTDNDGIVNCLDLDSDNDGIPDNVEAQSTLGYVVPSGNDTDLNGLDDAYEVTPGSGEGLTAVNTDGTDNPDYTDLDADNDGLSDTDEAGITLAINDADNDGLDDATDASGDYSDPGGTIDNILTGPVILPDGDGDANAGGDVDFRDAIANGDLSLKKGVDNSTPEVGDVISFRLRITNQGASTVTTIVAQDVIPGDFTYNHPDFTTSQGTVNFNSGTGMLEWDLGAYSLSPGNFIDLTYRVTVKVCGEFVNRAEIASSSIVDSDSTANNGN